MTINDIFKLYMTKKYRLNRSLNKYKKTKRIKYNRKKSIKKLKRSKKKSKSKCKQYEQFGGHPCSLCFHIERDESPILGNRVGRTCICPPQVSNDLNYNATLHKSIHSQRSVFTINTQSNE